MKKQEIIKRIEEIEITYDYEETYRNLYNACIDYMNEAQDWSLEHPFDNFISYDYAEEIGRNELENGGLIRMYCFLGNANLNNDLFKLNTYGNLEDVTKEDLDYLKEEILEVLSND